MNGWETLTLCAWPFFACHSTRAVLQAQNWFREEKQDSQEETEYREKSYKSSATWESYVACGAGHETDIYCAINTDRPRMTMDLLRGT